ncbi:MAG TPA: succinate--CoA ligase subunit alpha, partial [Afipia sp.]|nr:succinate--CoA ligase subunit alpha [Afipia sp.]
KDPRPPGWEPPGIRVSPSPARLGKTLVDVLKG